MILQQNTVELTKAELRALLAHASTDEARPHLCSVMVDAGACPPRLWATDGSRMAVAVAQVASSVGSTERTVVVVPRAQLDQACKLAGGRGRTIRLRLGPPAGDESAQGQLGAPPGTVSIEVLDDQGASTGAAFWAKRTDAVAPPLDQILPDPSPEEGVRAAYVHLDPAFLGDLSLVVRAAESDPHPHAKTAGIRVYSPTKALDPLALTCGAWTVVLMPMKGYEGGEGELRAKRAAAPAPAAAPDQELPAKRKGKGRKAA